MIVVLYTNLQVYILVTKGGVTLLLSLVCNSFSYIPVLLGLHLSLIGIPADGGREADGPGPIDSWIFGPTVRCHCPGYSSVSTSSPFLVFLVFTIATVAEFYEVLIYATYLFRIRSCTTFVHICKQRSVGELSSLPYLAALFNSGVWILCAQISDDQFVRWLNIGGAFVQAVYLIIFFACSSTVQRPWLFGYCLSTIVGYSVLVGFFFTGRRSYFDLVCMLSGVVSAASPLLNLVDVFFFLIISTK